MLRVFSPFHHSRCVKRRSTPLLQVLLQRTRSLFPLCVYILPLMHLFVSSTTHSLLIRPTSPSFSILFLRFSSLQLPLCPIRRVVFYKFSLSALPNTAHYLSLEKHLPRCRQALTQMLLLRYRSAMRGVAQIRYFPHVGIIPSNAYLIPKRGFTMDDKERYFRCWFFDFIHTCKTK